MERSPLARHPALAGGAALALGALSAPMVARALGPSLRLLGSTAERALMLASLAFGLTHPRVRSFL